MQTIRQNIFLRNLLWLIMLTSHSYFVLSYVQNTSQKIQINKTDPDENYFITPSQISLWAEKGQAGRNLSFQLIGGGIVLFSILLTSSLYTASLKHLLFTYNNTIKVFRLSPTYIINRVLLI